MHGRPDARLWAAWLVAAGLLLARPAAAAEALDIVVEGDSPELSRKLRAEIAYAGFVAVDAGSAGPTAASIRILSADRVSLSVLRPGDATFFEQTLERRPAESASFALRVVEVLRARLVDLGWTLPAPSAAAALPEAPPPSAPQGGAIEPAPQGGAIERAPEGGAIEPAPATSLDVSRTPDVADQPPAEAGSALGASSLGVRLWLGAGASGAWSSGGLGVAPHALLALRADIGADWAATLSANLPFFSSELDGAEGRADVSWAAYTAALEHALPLPAPWFGGIGLGAGLFLIDAEGQASGSFSGRDERLSCGAGFVSLSLGHALTDWLRLRATATAGSTAPRPVLRFDGREVASLGRGYGSLGLALELSWPEPETEAR